MNELRELNAAEMSAVEGGAGNLGDLLADFVAGLTELFTSQVIGPIIDGVTSFINDLVSEIQAFFDGLFS